MAAAFRNIVYKLRPPIQDPSTSQGPSPLAALTPPSLAGFTHISEPLPLLSFPHPLCM